jgi:hypothetical protein
VMSRDVHRCPCPQMSLDISGHPGHLWTSHLISAHLFQYATE